jgi:hypothetical protein
MFEHSAMAAICARKRNAINFAKRASKFHCFSVFLPLLFSRPETANAGIRGGATQRQRKTETAENTDEQARLALVATKQQQILE